MNVIDFLVDYINSLTSCLDIEFKITNFEIKERNSREKLVSIYLQRNPRINDDKLDSQAIRIITDSELLNIIKFESNKVFINTKRMGDTEILFYIDLEGNIIVVEEVKNGETLKRFEISDCKNAQIIFEDLLDDAIK